MRAFIVLLLIALCSAAQAGSVAGPAMHYVDSNGRYLGVFRNAVDSTTQAVVAAVSVPSGAVQVTTAPPAVGMKWDAATSAWVTDSDYAPPPPPPPTASEVLQLLVTAGVITQEQANSLVGGQ